MVNQVKMDMEGMEDIQEVLTDEKKKVDGWDVVSKVLDVARVAAIVTLGATVAAVSKKKKVFGFFLGSMAGIGMAATSNYIADKACEAANVYIERQEEKQA